MTRSPAHLAISASLALALGACGSDDVTPGTPDADAGVADAPDGAPHTDARATSAWEQDSTPREGFCDAPDATTVAALPATVVVDTSLALRDHARPSTDCTASSGAVVPDVVLTTTPPMDGTLIVRSDLPGTDPWIDTVLYVRSGCGGDGVELACDDDGAARGGASRVAADVTGGVPAYVVVDGASGAEVGAVEIAIDFVPAPTPSGPGGETCATATELAFAGDGDTMLAIASGDTSAATNDGGCASVPSTRNLRDVFYAFTLDDVRDVVVEVIPATYDAAFYVLTDCLDVAGLACVDTGPPGHPESATLPALAPGRYVIGIDAFAHPENLEWQQGAYDLRVTARRP